MTNELAVSNPFGGGNAPTAAGSGGAMVDVEGQRAIAETQAAMVIAKKFPRNQIEAMDRVLNACTRPTLAKGALYQYARGGTNITGPSIRLAEAIAQNWGNIDFGIKELEHRNGESTVMAYAHDLETNTRQVKIFHVGHKRYTKRGMKVLEDPRDIYEMVANQGARRLRACILGVIPGDVVETAQTQCETTLISKVDVTPEKLKSMVEMFEKFNVSKEMIEAKIQRRMDAITPALMVQLGKIYNSLNDGMSKPSEWFEGIEEEDKEVDKLNSAFDDPPEDKKAEQKAEPEKKPETKKAAPKNEVDESKPQDQEEEKPQAKPEQKEKKMPKWYLDDYGMLETMDVAGLEDFRDTELPKLKGRIMDSRLKMLSAHIETLIHAKG